MICGPQGAVKELLAGLGEFAAGKNIRAWAVGGCVRDWQLRRDTSDIDIAVEGEAAVLAAHLASALGAIITVHGRFGTASAQCGGLRVDFARARKETYSRHAALPVVSPAPIAEDLLRRDFSVNAIAYSIMPDNFGAYLDRFNGLADIKSGVVRVLHSTSFQDDPTRLFRACRFAGRFGWRIEDETARLFTAAVKGNYPALLSRERLRNELLCQLGEQNPAPGFALMEQLRLAAFLHPQLHWHAAAEKVSSAQERLGVLACALENKGPEFLKSLHMERALCAQLLAACAACAAKASSRTPLPEMQKNILKALLPGHPAVAFEPLLLAAADLSFAGAQGKDISRILDNAAKAQWRGEFTDKTTAKNWLKNQPA